MEDLTEEEKSQVISIRNYLRPFFENKRRAGDLERLVYDELMEKRKPKCKHTDIVTTLPDYENLMRMTDAKGVVESFRYMMKKQFICKNCNEEVYPVKFEARK